MLRVQRFIAIQVILFFVIAMAAIYYVGAHFVGISLFNPTYSMTVQLANTGGIFSNAEVDYRGYPVGRVGKLSLTAPKGCPSNCTGQYVYVTLHIDSGDKIPAGQTKALVADLSAVGEQYVDLEPINDNAPYLHSGSFIPAKDTAVPVSDETVLVNLNNLVKSVNLPDLETTVAELGQVFTETGPVLHQLVAAGDSLIHAANTNLPSNVELIDDGQQVLATQEAVAGDLATFSQNLSQFSGQLVKSDPDYAKLLPNGLAAATQLNDLLSANESALPLLLSNLITLNQITDVRVKNIKEIFVLYPAIINDSFLVVPGNGTADFGLSADQGSPVCTNGYLPVSKQRLGSGTDPATQYGGSADVNADCNASSSSDPRGARYAPRPAGDTGGSATGHTDKAVPEPAGPPPASDVPNASNGIGNPVSASTSSATTVLPYDTTSGAFELPGGGTDELGSNGGEAAVLGSQAWEYLLLAPTS